MEKCQFCNGDGWYSGSEHNPHCTGDNRSGEERTMVKKDRYCDCGHTEYNHDRFWDAPGCMVDKCYCTLFRDSYDFGAEADARYAEKRDREV